MISQAVLRPRIRVRKGDGYFVPSFSLFFEVAKDRVDFPSKVVICDVFLRQSVIRGWLLIYCSQNKLVITQQINEFTKWVKKFYAKNIIRRGDNGYIAQKLAEFSIRRAEEPWQPLAACKLMWNIVRVVRWLLNEGFSPLILRIFYEAIYERICNVNRWYY